MKKALVLVIGLLMGLTLVGCNVAPNIPVVPTVTPYVTNGYNGYNNAPNTKNNTATNDINDRMKAKDYYNATDKTLLPGGS